ncbi:MAG: type VI secretion system Vgr family protein [Acidiphilium sp.]
MAANVDLLNITTPLGQQPFTIMSVDGKGAISTCFHYTVILRSGTAPIDVDQILYKPVTIDIGQGGSHKCFLNGMVSKIEQIPASSVGSGLLGAQSYWDYELAIVPKLAFLDQTTDCRFFENKNAVDIAKTILNQFGITDLDFRVSGNPPVRPYTVMFNETYLGFFQRILAEAGLFYFFEHSETKHTLVVGDSASAFHTMPASPIKFASQSAIEAGIQTWQRGDATARGNTDHGDYNPSSAATPIKGAEPTILTASGTADRSHYHWPSLAPDSSTAQAAAKREMQAHEARAQIFTGGASIPNLYPGGKFSLTGDPTADGGTTEYVLREVSLSVTDAAGGVNGGKTSDTWLFLKAIKASVPWQPIPLPKPKLAGLYSATVIGPSGEEIYTDDLGRIKVKFPWDHRDETTPSGSFWLRVIQPWAGNGWGAQFIPRVGQEVAVTFLEGDIDRPVAIGALYNSTNKPIFAPADKNKSGFRSRSTKGGGTADYNEFSFDDTKGSEIVLLHAQKDHKIEVENDQTMDVGHNRTVTVKKDETITVDGNQTETVKGNRSFKVDGKHAEQVKGTQSITVTQAVTYESMQSITLKVGGNSIKIDQTGITLSGTMIKVSAEAQLQTTGAIAQHNASGMMTLQAGIIQVN